jgi:hypothetical protein
METNTPVPSEAPIKLTKSGKPRKPFVMTPARKEAFEKCRLARLAKRAEAGAPTPATENVQRAKEQAQRIDDAMGVTPTSVPRAVVPKKPQPVLKEKKIPQRKRAPKRSALELQGDPHPIVSPDMDTDEDPQEETEDVEPAEIDEETPNAEEEDEDAGEGEIVEDTPVRAVHTPDVKPRVHPVRVPPSILKRKRSVPMRPKLAESYHPIFHPDGESFLHEDEDEDEEGEQEHEEYSDEDEGYDAEEEQAVPSPPLS